jgi:hypothetical protein
VKLNNAILLLVFVPVLALAQVDTNWVARYDGPAHGGDLAQAMVVDRAGNVYVTGWSAGNGKDYATVKYGPRGELRWSARYDGPASGEDWPHSIAIDRWGNVFVTGQSAGNGTLLDYATVKYDSLGNQGWVARYDGPCDSDDVAVGVGVDTLGNVYVSGYSRGAGTKNDYATVKYDSSGHQQWVVRYDDAIHSSDKATAMKVDRGGNVYVTGTAVGADSLVNFTTIKYDNAGSRQWCTPYCSGGDQVFVYALALDSSGQAYATGYSDGRSVTIKYETDGNAQWEMYGQYGRSYQPNGIAVDDSGCAWITGHMMPLDRSYYDYQTVRYSEDGTEQRTMTWRGPGGWSNMPYGIAVDRHGNAYVTGIGYGPYSNPDVVTIKYDKYGNLAWLQRYDGPAQSSDEGSAVTLDQSGNVYVAGYSAGIGTGSDFVTLKYPARKPWGIYVFMCGDNDLEAAAINDVNEMERAVDPNQYSVVVQLDRIPGYDTSNGDWTNTRRFLVTPDTSSDRVIRSTLLDSMAEINMGNGSELVRFVNWAYKAYPAERSCVILWDHGSGWEFDGKPPADGVCDDMTDHDQIAVAGGRRELHRALKSIRDTAGRNTDIVAFDACLMAMAEVEYELKDVADYAVHSEETEPSAGYPYAAILGWLDGHPRATAHDLAAQIVTEYGTSYRPGGSQYGHHSVTLSAVDLGPAYDRFIRRFNGFATELVRAGGRDLPVVGSARDNCQHFACGGSHHNLNVDIKDFAAHLAADTLAPTRLRNAARSFADSLTQAVIASEYYSDPDDSCLDGATGVDACFPRTGVPYTPYDSLPLSHNCLWYEFLCGAESLPASGLLAYGNNNLGDYVCIDTLYLNVTLLNIGGRTARGITARLVLNDPFVTVLQDTSSYPDCASESTTTSRSTYVLVISDSTPIEHRIPIGLAVSCGTDGDTIFTSFCLIVDPARAACNEKSVSTIVRQLMLAPGCPNPFLGRTTISYALPRASDMSLVIYDASGRRVRTLVQGRQQPGRYQAGWDGRDERGSAVSHGVYFCALRTGTVSLQQKLVLLR